MAVLFLIFTLAIISIYWEQRRLGMGLLGLGILLTLFMFWHHITETLKINW